MPRLDFVAEFNQHLESIRLVECAFDDLFKKTGAKKYKHEEEFHEFGPKLVEQSCAFAKSRASCRFGRLISSVDARAIFEHNSQVSVVAVFQSP